MTTSHLPRIPSRPPNPRREAKPTTGDGLLRRAISHRRRCWSPSRVRSTPTNHRALALYVERQAAGSLAARRRPRQRRLFRHRRLCFSAQHQRDLLALRRLMAAVGRPAGTSRPSDLRSGRRPADRRAVSRREPGRMPRAIASSSLVGITSTVVGELSAEIRRAALAGLALRCSSSSMPNAAIPDSASRRTPASFSPTPAVKVMTSAVPSSAR